MMWLVYIKNTEKDYHRFGIFFFFEPMSFKDCVGDKYNGYDPSY